MRTQIVLLLLLLIFPLHSKSESIDSLQVSAPRKTTIIGKIAEKKSKQPIIQATVRLMSTKDSAIIKGTITDIDGLFSIKEITAGNYLLKISYMGFKTYLKRITVKTLPSGKQTLDNIWLEEDSRLLNELTVVGQRPEMIAKQDTLEYNADAFDMEEGATVEDILSNVPGIDVDEEGKIETKGKAVTKIYVDGKEMFKGDMTMVTKNIPADIIDKIQVITDKSELAKLTGIDDGVELTVINITIKKGKKQGWIVNAQAAGGASFDIQSKDDLRYRTKLYLNRIQNDDNMMLTLNSDNLRSGAGALGKNANHSVGLSLSSERNKKIKQYGDIRFNASDRSNYSRRYRENYFVDSTSYQRDSSQNESRSQGFSANYNISFKPNESHTIDFRPSFNLNHSESIGQSTNYTQSGDNDRTLVNFSRQQSNNNNDNYSFNSTLDYSWKINEKGRRLSTSVRLSLGSNESDGKRNSENRFLLLPEKDKIFDQESNVNGNNSSINAYLSFVEPIGDKNYINASYSADYGKQKNINQTYDYNEFTQRFDSLNPTYSKSFDNRSLDQRISLNFQRVRERYNLNVGADLNPNYKENFSYIHGGSSDGSDSIVFAYDGRTTVRYAPRARFSYNFNKHRHLRFDYNGQMNHPSVSQLDPTIDITNPLHIRQGNPDLMPTFTHTPSISFNNYNQEKQRSLSIDLRGRYIVNDIINITSYEAQTGVQTTEPRNESGTWDMSTSVSYNCPIGKKFQINNYTSARFNNQIGFTVLDKNSVKNISQTLSLNESFSISYRIKWLKTRLRLSLNYQDIDYSVSQKKGQQTLTYNGSSTWRFILPADWELGTSIHYRGTKGYSNSYNQQTMLWNMEISKRILPKNIGIIRLEINDILQQRLSIRRSYTANYMQDQQSSTQQSYFLLSFAINFNSMGGG